MNKEDTTVDAPENNEKPLAVGGPVFTDTDAERLALYTEVKHRKEKKIGHISYVAKKFNVNRKKATEIFDKIYDNQGKEPISEILNAMEDLPTEEERSDSVGEEQDTTVVPAEPKTSADGTLINYGTHVYNTLTDKYIVPLKTYGDNFVCTGAQHRAMKTAYSNWNNNPESYQDIANTYGMHINWVKEYFKIMKWTHASEPVTDEEVKYGDHKEAINRVLQQQKTKITQELQTKDWEQTQKDALEWRKFVAGKVDPFEQAIRKYEHKPAPALEYKLDNTKDTQNVFLLGLSDLHFGGKANSDELYSGADFNAEVITQIIDEYAQKIAATANNRTTKFEKCVVCVIGDILHTLTGFTEKGTRLEADVLREEQFDLAFKGLNRFITRMYEVFGKLEFHVVKGNHAGPDEYTLFHSIKNYYRTEKNVLFNLYKSRAAMFRVKNTAVLLDHGDSDFIKAKVPKGKERESYVQKRLLQNPDKLAGCTSRIMIQGDMHHFEQLEYPNFEFFMFGSPVTGDRYADHLALGSRPRQNCLVIGEDGVEEVLHYYFDR